MKILLISTLYHPDAGGGAEFVARNQAESLALLGHEVAVLTVGRGRGIYREVIANISIFRLGFRNLYFHHGSDRPHKVYRTLWHIFDVYNLWMKNGAAEVIQCFSPDVAICHNIAGWSISLYQALSDANVPLVQVLHDQYFLCVRSTMFRNGRRCEKRCRGCVAARVPHRLLSSKATALVGVSHFILDKMVSYGFFRETQLKTVVPNVTHLPIVEIAPRTSLPRMNIVFGFIGSLTANKGIKRLLEVFSRVCETNWTMLVAGTGDSDFERGLREAFASPRIVFLGRVDAANFYTQIDACIVPSEWEDTFPSVVFEALLSGVPVLGSNLGGIPEMIVPGKNGLLFCPTEIGIGEALKSFALDQFLWADRSATIRCDAARYGDKSGWARQWEQVLETSIRLHNEA